MEAIPAQSLALLAAVIVSSVVGSLHCAGMCGGLALFAVGADGKVQKRWPLHVGYHAGRGVAYTLVGAIAGSVGAAVDVAGVAGGWQRPAAMLAGGMMIAFGVIAILASVGVRGVRVGPPRGYQRLIEAAHRFAFSMPPVARAWGVGLLTPLLPCGWLYAFVIAAAGSGSAVVGAAVMAAFWLGTLPVMGSLGVGLQVLTGPLRRRAPVITASLVVVFGVLTASGRVSLPSFATEPMLADQPGDVRASIERVRGLSASDLPCCNGPVVPADERVAAPAEGGREP